jgi:hypothetical protein
MNTSTGAPVAPAAERRRRGSLARPRAVSVALAAAASSALAACGGGGASPSASSLLKDTFSSHKPISSGLLDASLELAGPGGARGANGFSLHLEGPFQSAGAGRLPQFALALTLGTRRRTLTAGATSTAGRLYLELGGQSFLAPAANLRALEQGYAQAVGGSSSSGGDSALATLGIEPSRWLIHPSVAGSTRTDGADAVHIVSGLDTARFLADAARLSSAGLAFGAGLITPARAAALSSSLRAARVDVYAGRHDHLLRRLALHGVVSRPRDPRGALAGLAGGTLSFVLQLSRLDQPQTISAPSSTQPLSQLPPLLERLGLAAGPGPHA